MKNFRRIQKERDDQGAVAFEFVFFALPLVALLVAVASFGVFFSNKIEVNEAARDAARTLALRRTPTYPLGMSPVPGSIVTCTAGDTVGYALITLTMDYTFDIPLVNLSPNAKKITATGTMRCGG